MDRHIMRKLWWETVSVVVYLVFSLLSDNLMILGAWYLSDGEIDIPPGRS